MPSLDSVRYFSSPRISILLAQILGGVLAVLFAFLIPEMRPYPTVLIAIQGAGAAIASHYLGAPSWWQFIHLIFGPAALLASRLPVSPWVWLTGFVLLYLVFGRTDRTQVPLFLSNSTTGNALLALLPDYPCYVIDIGCGNGALLRQLARARPDSEFVGIEHALLTYLWARLLTGSTPNVHIRLGDFWKQPLTPYDLVYAFLSPAPMSQLWSKARTEMRPDTQLVSNSFPIEGIITTAIIAVDDRRKSQLHCYKVPEEA